MLGLQKRQTADRQIVYIETSSILPNPNQPRKHFDNAQLLELAQSISENGILQPITVRYNSFGQPELVSGERRLRASKIVGLEKVPCIVVEMRDDRSAVFALLENIQREDLNFFEEAEGIETLIKVYGFTQEMCALKLGKAQSTLSNKLRLLKIDPAMRRMIIDNGLTERHARALLKLESDSLRSRALHRIIENNLNVSQSERLIAEMTSGQCSFRQHIRIVKDVRIFLNTINNAVDVMRKSGIDAAAESFVKDGYVEYLIKIPTSQNFSD